MRIGHGYDAHRFQNDRDLILGGEKIDYEKGMLAHSDGDVALHALCDALLGAAALGDLGRHFPDSDPQYKGIASRVLVERIMAELAASGYRVGNADLTIIAQQPRLEPYIPAMKANIARYLGISPDNVNVKATTTEKMGFEGRGEGISAHAVVLLESV
ncbi:MAG: 2-C-methyl-D-erythritol 2,4-cyclodiphosphate synthase [Methylococcaceae bacterium]|nr:2-C-methyl-D-erythritol 2,4-cyclodiphosphate synthase [Methylococcaceae bacterium]